VAHITVSRITYTSLSYTHPVLASGEKKEYAGTKKRFA
jgi:hypothetical protein